MSKVVALLFASCAVGWSAQAPAPQPPPPLDVQKYVGLYALPDRSPLLVWSPGEGQLAFGFDQGQLRGLVGQGEAWRYGPSLGVVEPEQGRVTFVRDRRGAPTALAWTHGGVERTAARVPLEEREVRFTGGVPNLSGTVILPKRPRGGVVFLHGSGEETREPSRVFAYILAREGWASIIFDKRSTGRSAGDTFNTAFADLARDAAGAMAALRKELGRNLPVGYFGPSQGGWVAIEASALAPAPSFIVLQSADVTSPFEQTMYQGVQMFRLRGRLTPEEQVEAQAFRRQKYLYAITGQGQVEFEQALAVAREKRWFEDVGEFLPNLGFWRPNGLHDPMPAFREYSGPVLAVFGGMDINKDIDLNVKAMRDLLEPRKNGSRVVVFPEANHGIFATQRQRIFARELPFVTNLAPGYLEELTSWLRAR